MRIHLARANNPMLPQGRQLRASLGDHCIPLYRGAYLDTRTHDGSKPTPQDLHAARTFAVTQRNVGVVSGVSAANLHGLPLLRHRLEDDVVLTRKSTGTPGAGLRIRRSLLDEDDVSEHYGMRVTTLRRTLVDLADFVAPHEFLAAADAAMQRGFDIASLPEFGRNCRTFAWAQEHASPRSESIAESWCRALIIASDLPRPLLQVDVFDEFGNFVARVDMAWPELGVCFEFDGAVKYQQFLRPGESAADAVMREKRRERALIDLGWTVSRGVWADLRDARTLPARLRRDLTRAAALNAPRGSWAAGTVQPQKPYDFSALFGFGPDAPLVART